MVFNEVIKHYDCSILEGHRSLAKQKKLFEDGKTKVKVSKHNAIPSKAADVAPCPIKWDGSEKIRARFYHFAGFVLGVAAKQGITLRWGGDWSMDHEFEDQVFDDLVHFELIDE